MDHKVAKAGLPFLLHPLNHAAHATLICCAAPIGNGDESLTLFGEGADPLAALLGAVECASERRAIALVISGPGLSNDWLFWPDGCVAGTDGAAPGSIRRIRLSAFAEPYPRPPQSPAILDHRHSANRPFPAGALAYGEARRLATAAYT